MGLFDLFKKKPEEATPVVPRKEARFEIHTERIDPDARIKAPKGAELSYLDAKALKFWNRKQTDFEIPPYYSESAFGRNVGPALYRLLNGKYLESSDLQGNIALKTVPELKAVLSQHGLKVSGKKADLISRLMDSLSEEELKALFPVGAYKITEKGRKALEPYSIIEANDEHALGFSYYRLLNERGKYPDDSNEVILTRMLSAEIQELYKSGDQARYLEAVTKTGRFMDEIGKPALALECYILGFFIYAMQVKKYPELGRGGQSFYLASRLEQCGRNENYSLDELTGVINSTLKKNNPFRLATHANISFAISLFKKSLSM